MKMCDPISDTKEQFEQIAVRLLTAGAMTVESLTHQLVQAYQLGILMGAAAERASNAWDLDEKK